MHNAFFSTDNTQMTRGEYLYIILYMTNIFQLIIVLKVHKIENFFGSNFEFYTISLLVLLKY